ncbi:hypothetical protein H0Z60_12665 [Ectothiorhodospiraceae bacterium WFHF3C12]|nr:hypothetical protein [Ectothiorhodospiraceae bacterium WFHF3C12]
MDTRHIIRESMACESRRIRFLERSRGTAAAREFAMRTRTGYRSAVLRRSAPAAEVVFRLRLLGSYCYLKRYLDFGASAAS